MEDTLTPSQKAKAKQRFEGVKHKKYPLAHMPKHLIDREMCEFSIEKYPGNIRFVPDEYKTPEMCKKALDNNLLDFMYILEDLPHFFEQNE